MAQNCSKLSSMVLTNTADNGMSTIRDSQVSVYPSDSLNPGKALWLLMKRPFLRGLSKAGTIFRGKASAA